MRLSTHSGNALHGSAQIVEHYYEVNWPWVYVPWAILFLTAWHLVGTISKSRHIPVWKGSTVVLMDCVQPGYTMKSENDAHRDVRTRGLHVQLVHDVNNNTWRLV